MKSIFLFLFFCFQFIASGQMNVLDTVFTHYERIIIDTDQLYNTISKSRSSSYHLLIGKWDLELEKSDLFSPSYRVEFASQNEAEKHDPSAIPLHGLTKEGGLVSLTIAPGFLQGFVYVDEVQYSIEPTSNFDHSAEESDFTIYKGSDLKSKKPITCAWTEVPIPSDKLEPGNRSQNNSGLCYEIEYAIVSDYSMFLKYGASGLQARNISILNDVNTNFQSAFSNEIRYVLTGQYISNCPNCDPWTNSLDFSDVLDDFRSWSNFTISNPGNPNYISNDVASFWSDRWDNSFVVGQAFLGGICTSNKYNILSDFSTNSNALRVLVAHELGHNLNAFHDPPGSGSIMAPSINITNTWSSSSIIAIDNYVQQASCLAFCSDLPPTVYWNSPLLNLTETSAQVDEEKCIQGFEDYVVPIKITESPSSDVTVEISSSSPEAIQGIDYELLTSQVIFTSTSALTQNVVVRIYDDYVIENDEVVSLDFAIIMGEASPTSITTVLLNIVSDDKLISVAESPGDTFFYGNNLQLPSSNGFFEGERTDVRTRFLISSDSLISMGMEEGNIDMLSFFVFQKESNGMFENVQLGLSSSFLTSLIGQPWQTTQVVFQGNIETVESAWNAIDFSTPYYWDGVSNIYVDMCFANSSSIGNDKIVLFSSEGSQEQLYGYSANTLSNCGTVSTEGFTFDRAPVLQLRQKQEKLVENWAINKASSYLRSGEKAVFISERNRVIASIENTGAIDLGCTEVAVRSEGVGQNNLDFGNGLHSDKSYRVKAEHEGSYHLEMYYTPAEHALWQNEQSAPSLIVSENVITAAQIDSSQILSAESITTIADLENALSYKVQANGDRNIALTNWASPISNVSSNIKSKVMGGSLTLTQVGNGLIFFNSLGDRYVIRLNSQGSPLFFKNSSIVANTTVPNGDLYVDSNMEGLRLTSGATFETIFYPDASGNLARMQNVPSSSDGVKIEASYLELSEWGAGLVMRNTSGECVKLFVDDAGVLRTGFTDCP